MGHRSTSTVIVLEDERNLWLHGVPSIGVSITSGACSSDDYTASQELKDIAFQLLLLMP